MHGAPRGGTTCGLGGVIRCSTGVLLAGQHRYTKGVRVKGTCRARSNGIPDSDAAIRQFLALSSGARAGEADRTGPSSIDIRDMRSLSLSFSFPSFSLMGPPIGVSLPDSDLTALKRFLRGSVGGNGVVAPDGTPPKVLPASPSMVSKPQTLNTLKP